MVRRSLFVGSAYVGIAALVVAWGWLLTHPLAGSVGAADDDAARWVAGERTGWLDPVAQAGTLLGETPVGLGVAAVVAVVGGLALRSVGAAVFVVLADVGHGGIYWLASHADPRDRPPVEILDPGLVPTHSFPSGHVGTAVAVYGAAAVLLAVWLRGRPRRGGGVLVALLVCVPLFVAASRVYEGAHHLTDVATSLLYGAAWLAVLGTALALRRSAPEGSVPRS